ncbi:MAG: CCA tRNA nucleotidyltransferase [Armatimonadetes bacterium]|nr:CCA tRNA nucleotidyltransferase [Armatimonadota bacterium]
MSERATSPASDLADALLRIASLARQEGRQVFLVGGSVRDLLMGREVKDIDLAAEGDTLALARALARLFRGSPFAMDAERGIARMVRRRPPLQIDIAPLAGRDILSDLRARDYTLNAVAVPLDSLPEAARADPAGWPLIDPTGGIGDIRAGRVRMVAEANLRADPVRTLRGVRMTARLGLEMEPRTAEAIRRTAPALSQSAPERIRDEFFMILEAGGVSEHLRRMDDLGLLSPVLPESEAMQAAEFRPGKTLWDCSLAVEDALPQAERMLPVSESEETAAHLGHMITYPRSRRSLLAFAAIYHAAFPPILPGGNLARQRARVLKLSAREVEHIGRTVALRSRNPYPPCDLKTAYRFFREAGDSLVEILLLSQAVRIALGEDALEDRTAFTGRLLQWAIERKRLLRQPKLTDGHELQERFGMKPGREIGWVLEALRKAQAEGLVKTREDALRWLEGHIVEGRFAEED